MMVRPHPVGLPGLVVFGVGAFAFFVALLAARQRRQGEAEADATRSFRSWGGVMLQGLGLALAGIGRIDPSLDPWSPAAIGEAVAVAALMAGAVGLFAWASRTMGRNWSIVARTRTDHELVQTGPFAWVRHPIYAAMALFAVAMAIAYGHVAQLVIALPVFALGTWRRIAFEERLLRDHFGAAYDAYAARVKRFVPGLF